MSASGKGERARRARAIWGYSGVEQGPLADKAEIDRKRFKAIMGLSRVVDPTPDELLRLVVAVPTVPRQFAERGFEGLLEPVDQLTKELAALRREINQLSGRVVTLEQEARARARGKQRRIA